MFVKDLMKMSSLWSCVYIVEDITGFSKQKLQLHKNVYVKMHEC